MMGKGQLEHSIALDAAKREIAERIRRVCQHFTEADFTALVNRMAEIDVKYRLREDWLFQTKPGPRLSYN
jgi:hypothetical protein